ncbi:mediator complex subunit [Emydomyces testavorans]|uniref:Mediator of RNA polymerase II transcription subunit 14 n=1 Tax=Emydomyces testavorans TaxID=2070801 RepID=A0AAF0II95_9EURO|nr:mediator complex subunit [Emydomyces testavorans]
MPGLAMDGSSAFASETAAPDVDCGRRSMVNGNTGSSASSKAPVEQCQPTVSLNVLPPELAHVTLGFFPFARLINRVVQQAWNNWIEFLNDIGSPQAAQMDLPAQFIGGKNMINGRCWGDQSSENLLKKIRILEFAQSRRAEFIKLLVLSQWSRQAREVSRLIDLQAFIRTRCGFYEAAPLHIGNMKRDLVGAQLGNPDLKTALEVLSAGEIRAMPEFDFLSSRALTPCEMLKTLQRINKLITLRLTLCENVPDTFVNYFVHDGRVTFIVPSEFEVDLSVASESRSAQFYFIDMRFLFAPSSFPKGVLRAIVEQKINTLLMNSGLVGCFNLLHNFVLTHKITVLFKQAAELSRGAWSGHLHVELLRRTLVIQYWKKKPGGKSWIEIGVRSSSTWRHRGTGADTSFLHLRWVRDSEEVDSTDVEFNSEQLSAESTLFSVISLHITHVLRSTFKHLRKNRLYSSAGLHIGMHSSSIEPGNCFLEVQLTQTSHMRMIVEAVSGDIVLRVVPASRSRHGADMKSNRGSVEDIVGLISRLRCVVALEEVESHAKAVGWVPLNLRRVHPENLRRIFPPNALRSMLLFREKSWELPWLVAFTSTADGDNWWIVRLRVGDLATVPSHRGQFYLHEAKVISGWFNGSSRRLNSWSFSNLVNAFSGMVVVQSNVDFLNEFGVIRYFPPAKDLLLHPCLRVPSIYLRFRYDGLPSRRYKSLSGESSRRSSVHETLRVSYKGIVQQSGCAIIVVYGRLMTVIDNFGALYANSNGNVAFQPKGPGFAILFSVPVGSSIIASLLDKLQQIDNTALVVELMKKKGFRPLSLSTSRINFAYPGDDELHASIKFSYDKQGSQATPLSLPASNTLTRLQPLMGIEFNARNPHRRIKESLTAVLNFHKDGFHLVAELLGVTLPLLRALEQICADTCAANARLFKAQFAARSSKRYQIRYPFLQYRFHLSASQRKSHVVWILQNSTAEFERSNHPILENLLREQVYNSRGDGWRGINQGGIAYSENADHLIFALHQLIKSYILTRIQSKSHSGQANTALNVDSEVLLSDNNKIKAHKHRVYTAPQEASIKAGMEGSPTAGNRNIQHQDIASNADVITID